MSAITDVTLEVPADEHTLQQFAEVLSPSLGVPLERALPWLRDDITPANLRVVKREGHGDVVAGAGTIWMGQWFGGKSVPLVGINAVAVAPEKRASGIGRAMMRALLRELRDKGVALSGLYPATYPVYRAVGYESAGTFIQFALDPSTLGVRDATLSVRLATPADHETLRRLYTERARRSAGNLDRDAFIWNRVFRPGGARAMVYLIERADHEDPQGYLALTQAAIPGVFGQEMTVRDLVALTPAAGRRILSFLGEHRSIVKKVLVNAAPADPLFMLVREEPNTVQRFWHWMLRVVDVRAALEARGYPPGLRAEVHFDLHDETLPENHGRWVLDVCNGSGSVRQGGTGAIALDARALAAMYSGYLSPHALHTAGLVQGTDEALDVAAAVFAGPAPWMPDFY